jgi:hypothetical protein
VVVELGRLKNLAQVMPSPALQVAAAEATLETQVDLEAQEERAEQALLKLLTAYL